jgi:ABC-2 type transport system permease protein
MKIAVKIFKKEIKEVIKNRSIWLPVLIITVIFSLAFPTILTLSIDKLLEDPDTLEFIEKIFPGQGNPQELLISFAIKQLIIFLLLIPAMLPSLIAPASIIMEKDSKTLEPLLATPIKTHELLLGKTLTSIIPSFIISTISFLILVLTIDITAYIKLGIIPLPTVEWIIVAFIVSPTISFIITMLSVIISSKSTDIRSAQGIGSVVIFPIYAIIGFQIGGFFLLNKTYLLIGCLVLIMICPMLLKLGIKIFDRENILTKWKIK